MHFIVCDFVTCCQGTLLCCPWQQWKRHLANIECEVAAVAACLLEDAVTTRRHGDCDDDDDDDDVVASGRVEISRRRLVTSEKMEAACLHGN